LFHGCEHQASNVSRAWLMVIESFEYLMSRVCVTNPGKTRTHNPDDIPFAFFFFYKSIFALKTALFWKKKGQKNFAAPTLILVLLFQWRFLEKFWILRLPKVVKTVKIRPFFCRVRRKIRHIRRSHFGNTRIFVVFFKDFTWEVVGVENIDLIQKIWKKLEISGQILMILFW